MQNTLRTSLACLTLSCLTAPLVQSQQEFGGRPVSLERRFAPGLQRRVPTVRPAAPDLRQLLLEDEARQPGDALRFGATLPVELDLTAEPATVLADGRRVWRTRVTSPGAHSLSLVFERFQLPPEGELFVYNDDRSVVRGAYTYRNQNARGSFAIQPVPGEALTLEYIEPGDTPDPGVLRVSSVIHDYLNVFDVLASGACNIDTACAPLLDDQVRATVKTISGPLLCSGVLVNNTAEDGTQYLLTGEHCGDMEDAVFLFGFQRPTCGSGTAPANQSVQGAVTLVKDAAIDFQLVRILSQIPAAFDPYLAGWDNSGIAPTDTFAVHHPSGDEKAVCVDLNAPVPFAGTRWRVLNWEAGTTETGSSGCGLFDPNGLVIGCLEGGFASCADPSDDRFVRMDVMWPQLAPWLDPLGLGVANLGGFDPGTQPPQPLSATATLPAQVPILQPGLGKDVRILGTGFSDATVIEVDGVAIDTENRGWVNTGTLEFDFPQRTAPGSVTVTVREGGSSVDLTVDVVPGTEPKLQIGNGEPGNQLFGNAPFLIGGQPGDLVLVTFSSSNLPSLHPAWMLEYGNQFTEILFLGSYTIPGTGLVQVNSPTTGITLTRFYSTSTLINGVFPALQSNLQEVLVVF